MGWRQVDLVLFSAVYSLAKKWLAIKWRLISPPGPGLTPLPDLDGLCIHRILLYNTNRTHTIQNTARKCDMRPDGRRLEGGCAARWTAARRDAARRMRLGEMTPFI